MKTFICSLLVSTIAMCPLLAKPPGTVFAKNGGSGIMHVWVNGYYQGYVRPGETRYSVSDGFITNDSGNGRDGKPVKESHGGWDHYNRETATIEFQFANGKPSKIEATANAKGEIWFGGTNGSGEPPIPTDIEVENAPAIIKGSKPSSGSADGDSQSQNNGSSTQPIVGTFTWTPKDQIVTIKPDGTATSSYNVTATWKVVDKSARRYELRWSNGFVDDLTVSADGTTITGSNQYGAQPDVIKRQITEGAAKGRAKTDEALDLRAFVGTYRGGVGSNQSTYWTDITISADGFVTVGSYESFSGLGSTNYASPPRTNKYRVIGATKSELTYEINENGKTFRPKLQLNASGITFLDGGGAYKRVK